jgi:hypothetical protein
MKQYITILFFISIIGLMLTTSSCGYSSMNNESVGQVKSVRNVTPLFCPNYSLVDVSLGVMQNGTGSVSKQDVEFVVSDIESFNFLMIAQDSGKLVKIHHNDKRLVFCTDTSEFITKVEMLK